MRIVKLILQKALEGNASDIHIEPFEQKLLVGYACVWTGVLQDLNAPPVNSTAAVISRIKIMAKLNIAERRIPQDGRINVQIPEVKMWIYACPLYPRSMAKAWSSACCIKNGFGV